MHSEMYNEKNHQRKINKNKINKNYNLEENSLVRAFNHWKNKMTKLYSAQ